jgi:trimethylamine--corrinoid protein Co-methyltransferase
VRPAIQPIRPRFRVQVLTPGEIAEIKSATLHVMEQVGVQFPSERALDILASHGAQVDRETQVARLPADLVLEAIGHAPRAFTVSGRADGTDLVLDGTQCYFSTDGCGVHTVDLDTGEQRPSSKQDVALMARVSDYLSSIAFYWPLVSAQDCGRLAPLHELDASFGNTVKHVQTETVMGEKLARYAVRMAEVVAEGRSSRQSGPPLSSLVCTIAPLGQDKEGIEGAMVFVKAGIPVGFMSMPNMGATAPASIGGALVQASAEIISGLVLMQLVAPGAPVYYSIVSSVMDPHSATYINTLSEKYLSHAAAVQIAHDWGVPILGGAFGTQNVEPDTWMQGRDSVYTSLLVPLAGADWVVGLGLLKASTVLLAEQLLLDDEIYHTHRILAEGIDVSADGLAVDTIAAVGPRGHFMAQKHTRRRMREIWFPELSHPRPGSVCAPYSSTLARARASLDQIIADHRPDPLPESTQADLNAILEAARTEVG